MAVTIGGDDEGDDIPELGQTFSIGEDDSDHDTFTGRIVMYLIVAPQKANTLFEVETS